MAEIKINHAQIASVQARINQDLAHHFHVVADTWVEDSSTNYINQVCNLVRESTEGLASAVYQFNTYINSLSEHFQEKDNQLASAIKGVTVQAVPSAKQQAAQQKQKAKASKTYKKLP